MSVDTPNINCYRGRLQRIFPACPVQKRDISHISHTIIVMAEDLISRILNESN